MPPLVCRFSLAAVMLALAAPSPSASAQGPAPRRDGSLVVEAKPVKPEEAAKHVGEWCVVTMKVSSSRLMADAGRCYLNSRKDHRDNDNFTAVIFKQGLEKFAKAEIDDPAKHFLDKTVRVTGTIELYKEKPQIKVELVDQIELVDAPAQAAGARQE
jgi:DNA/RNA endonuclease YhcR with UshA esterase domain